MSDGTTTTTATTEKTFSQKDIEIERGHAQHFKSQVEELTNKLKAFDGVDPNDYKKTKTELEEVRRTKALGDPKEMDAWKATTEAEIRKTVQKDLEAAIEKANKYAQQNKELTVTDRVFAVAAPSVTEDMGDFIKDQIRKFGDLNDKGEVIFKDEQGNPRYAPGSTTELMKTEQFVDFLKDKYPSSFKATDKGGAKTPGQKTPATATNGRVYTMAEISRMPDKGAQLFKENPELAKKLLQGASKH